MKLFSPTEFSKKATEAFKRFPFVIMWVILAAIALIAFANEDVDVIFEERNNFTLTAILGVSWLIGAQFYIEQFKRKGLWWIKIIVIILLGLFYYYLPVYDPDTTVRDGTPYIRWVLYFITGHLALLFAPFVTVWHPKAYWNYLSSMFVAISRSILFSGVLFLGLVLAMLAIQYLFGIEIQGKRYFQLFIACLGIVNTWVYLSDFPKEIQHTIHLNFHKAIEVFVKFILIPLAGLYIIILYAYAFKILIQWELPKGWVSYLITILSGLLYIIQSLIHPVRIGHESRLIRKFQPLVYWLLLPLLILLYVAIYKRISDYGVTEARYFLCIIAVFISGATLYLIFSRKQELRYLPIALAIFTLGSSFGPWGVFSVSKTSQIHEFEEMYTAFAKAKKNTTITKEEYSRFKSITSYLHNRDAIHELKPIIGYNPETTFTTINSWEIASKIIDSLGLNARDNEIENRSLHYTYTQDKAISVKYYQWGKNFYLRADNVPANIVDGYSIQLSKNGQFIHLLKNDSILIELSAKELLVKLQDKDASTNIEELEKMQLQGSSNAIDISVHFTSLNLRKDSGSLIINYARGIVLLNIKE